jgi:methylglutaconyl-CoA hydratase
VGRIAGHCIAGGMGLAAAMDISIALEDARFGFTEVRVGVAPAVISVVCLPKLRPADARSAFLRGNRFTAAEAARMGLINAAVPTDQLDAAVDAVVTDLLAGGPQAIAAAKRLLAEVPASPVDEAFRWTAELSARLFAGEEAAEGMRAFLEKRPAAWVHPTPGEGG